MNHPTPSRRQTVAVLATATATAACASLVTAGAMPASAAAGSSAGRSAAPKAVTLTRKVYAPFQLDYSGGALYVADGGTARVSRLTAHGLQTVARGPRPGEVAGVARSASGQLAYTSSAGGEQGYTRTTLTVLRPGRSKLVVNLLAFERRHNPDHAIHYGIDHPTRCQVKAFQQAGLGPASYRGLVDSHPYAVTSLGKGSWAVADAAGNDLLRVDPRGSVSLIKVLPRQPFSVTADIAKGLGLPKCVVGAVYNFEPVPTDVEVGPHGALYSTLLPGGPEDPSFGARGSIYRLDAATGRYRRLAGGIAGGTNLAVTSGGSLYVAGLFSGTISKVSHGRIKPYLSLPGVVSLTAGGGHLFAGTLDLSGNGPGSIVRIG